MSNIVNLPPPPYGKTAPAPSGEGPAPSSSGEGTASAPSGEGTAPAIGITDPVLGEFEPFRFENTFLNFGFANHSKYCSDECATRAERFAERSFAKMAWAFYQSPKRIFNDALPPQMLWLLLVYLRKISNNIDFILADNPDIVPNKPPAPILTEDSVFCQAFGAVPKFSAVPKQKARPRRKKGKEEKEKAL